MDRIPSWTTIVVCCLAAFVQSACLLESRADQRPASGRQRLAKEVIVTHKCGTCHTLAARGLRLDGTVGPDLTRQGLRGRSASWLRRQLLAPRSIPDSEVAVGFEGMQKVMPPHDLSEVELEALVEFLNSLR